MSSRRRSPTWKIKEVRAAFTAYSTPAEVAQEQKALKAQAVSPRAAETLDEEVKKKGGVQVGPGGVAPARQRGHQER